MTEPVRSVLKGVLAYRLHGSSIEVFLQWVLDECPSKDVQSLVHMGLKALTENPTSDSVPLSSAGAPWVRREVYVTVFADTIVGAIFEVDESLGEVRLIKIGGQSDAGEYSFDQKSIQVFLTWVEVEAPSAFLQRKVHQGLRVLAADPWTYPSVELRRTEFLNYPPSFRATVIRGTGVGIVFDIPRGTAVISLKYVSRENVPWLWRFPWGLRS